MRRWGKPRALLSLFVSFVMAAWIVPASVTGTADDGFDLGADPGEVFDSRAGLPVLAPSPGQQGAIASLVDELPGVHVRWNPAFGTPATIVRYGDALSGSSPGQPDDIARAWLGEHAGLFGWSADDASALALAKSLAQPADGPHAVLFHQTYGGMEGGSLGGSVMVTVDHDGRVLLVRANATRGTGPAGPGTLTAADAFQAATGVAAPEIVGTTAGWTTFAAGTFAGSHYAEEVAFPTRDGARPAWEVIWAKQLDEGYRTVVDAVTGEVLFRTQVVRHSEPEGTVFRNHPGAPEGGTQEVVSFAGDPEASPQGWVSLGGLDTPTTVGNNAHTATNWAVFIAPEGGEVRPVDPFAHFHYDFVDAWSQSNCGANPISEDLEFPDTPTYALDALPAVTNLFYHHNLMHDFWYLLGFDESAGNMQVDNFGNGGEGGDPLLGLVQAGAVGGDAPTYFGRDNAYMFPMPDGIPQWSGMFIWEPIPDAFLAPCVDGDFAADVIYHEYAHGVTSRWVGGEFGNLDTFQGGSMGEAWSDFAALHYLQSQGLESEDVLGRYVTGNAERGIRNWPLSEVAAGFGDIGYDTAGDEVHSDGEIWAGVLWDLRQALAGSAGTDYVMQIVADAMPISGPLPSMLDMRDAILTADLARTGGQYQDAMWAVFAVHGMGVSAQTVDANDTNPRPGFDVPDRTQNGFLRGRVTDEETRGAVSGARIFVGEFEARTSPVQRTNDRGIFGFPILAGTYPLTIQAPGYGSRTIEVQIAPGRGIKLSLRLAVNLASTAAGAVVVESSNPSVLGGPELALSDSEVNAWWTDDDGNPTNEHFVVDLAGDEPVTIAEIQVSAFNTPGHRFEALRDFSVYASVDGVSFAPVLSGSFPTTPPRPVTADLHYRRFTLASPVEASFLKFVAEHPQSDTAGGVQVAEVQVFGSGDVMVEEPDDGGVEPVHDEGLALVPTADAILTTTLMEAGACVFPPPTQGLDAWVTELPDGYQDGTRVISVQPESDLPQVRADVDVYFLSGDCQLTGSIATASAGESGTIPQGTRYVVSQLYTSFASRIVVDAGPVE